MRLHRLIAILLLIESRGQIKAKELASALETSIRTVYRDIEILCQAGIPIATTTGPNGGVYFMEGYSAKLYNLHGDDAVNLYLTGVAMYKGDTGLDLKNALLKLEKILPPEYCKDVKVAKERFYFDECPWWSERPDTHCLEILRKSVWNSKKLQIEYLKANNETSIRELHPYGLIVKNMQWYLIAFCEKSKKVKTFKCERIIKANLTDTSFQFPMNFNLEQYWKDSEKQFKNACKLTEKYPVLIKLHKDNIDIMKELEIYEAEETGEYIVAKVNMHKFEFACTKALEIVWHVEILNPVELRNYVQEKLFDISKVYSI
jgi:predicted DNA-binding transcriptional regulator YafY